MTDIQRRKLSDSDITKLASLNAADLLYIERSNEAYALSGSAITELVESVPATFPTVGNAAGAANIVVGEYIHTLGYYSAGDGGGGTYLVVADGTGTVDDVTTVQGNGVRLQLQHNGTIAAEQAGAVSGTEASASIQAAWDALYNWQQANAVSGVYPHTCLTHKSNVTIRNSVKFEAVGTGTTDFMNFDLRGSTWTAVSGGDLSTTTPMLKVRSTEAVGFFGYMDGAKAYCCLTMQGVSGSRFYHPQIRRHKGHGIRVHGSSGAMQMFAPHILEYQQSDDEFGEQSNYTSTGLLVESGDWNCYGANVLFNGKGVYIGEDAVQFHLTESHLVQGNPLWGTGSEPIVILLAGQSNTGLSSSATSGDKTVEAGVYIWNGDFETHGDSYAQAAFGTAPLNQGSAPWVNNPAVHAANDLKTATGRDVYIIWIADGGRKIESFLKPSTLTANGWSAAVNFTDYMYPDIKDACQAVPGRNSSFPDLVMWQQGEANDADSAAVYQAKLEALVQDMIDERVCHPDLTEFRAGGLVPAHAFLSDHQTAVTGAASTFSNVEYVSSSGLSDVGDSLHFTGASLVTLGERYAASITLDNLGADSAPFTDGILIENHATRENHVHGCYFDNGVVDDYTATLNIDGGHYVHNNAATIFEPKIRIYASSASQQTFPDLRINNVGGLASVGFLPYGGNTWSGDWATLADYYANMADEDRDVSVKRTQYNLYPDSASEIAFNYKPTGDFTDIWRAGPDELRVTYAPSDGLVKVSFAGTTGLMAVSNSAEGQAVYDGSAWRIFTDQATNKLFLGAAADVGIEAGSGNVYLWAGGARQWESRGTGALRPINDNTQNLGATTARIANGYITQLRPGAGSLIWTAGSGSPEGVLTAPVGSLYSRDDGGAGTSLYVKESGTGNTGWVPK